MKSESMDREIWLMLPEQGKAIIHTMATQNQH